MQQLNPPAGRARFVIVEPAWCWHDPPARDGSRAIPLRPDRSGAVGCAPQCDGCDPVAQASQVKPPSCQPAQQRYFPDNRCKPPFPQCQLHRAERIAVVAGQHCHNPARVQAEHGQTRRVKVAYAGHPYDGARIRQSRQQGRRERPCGYTQLPLKPGRTDLVHDAERQATTGQMPIDARVPEGEHTGRGMSGLRRRREHICSCFVLQNILSQCLIGILRWIRGSRFSRCLAVVIDKS